MLPHEGASSIDHCKSFTPLNSSSVPGWSDDVKTLGLAPGEDIAEPAYPVRQELGSRGVLRVAGTRFVFLVDDDEPLSLLESDDTGSPLASVEAREKLEQCRTVIGNRHDDDAASLSPHQRVEVITDCLQIGAFVARDEHELAAILAIEAIESGTEHITDGAVEAWVPAFDAEAVFA